MDTPVICKEDLYFEHKQWKSELDFWALELKFFNKQLKPLVLGLTDKSVMARVGHFQNQFVIHMAKLGEIHEAIEDHEYDLYRHAKAGVEAIDRIRYKSHMEYRERMNTERVLYQQLKKDYYEFLVHVIALDFEF